MKIRRNIIDNLVVWKNSNDRKPLILMGARQVGKTWIMKEFGNAIFKNMVYVNFDLEKEVYSFFESSKNPQRIIQNLSFYYSTTITPGDTLLVFDEVQECNTALNSLKYFCEDMPELHIVCAGSLLGVALSKGDSFPVGKVDFANVYPVTFKEFLQAKSPNLVDYINSLEVVENIPEAFFNVLKENYWYYMSCGGMPEAVSKFLETGDMSQVDIKLSAILSSYRNDFSKHADNNDIKRIEYVWNSIPSQLAKENRKFLYQLVKTGARAREYEDAIYWLTRAGLVNQVFCIDAPNIPLSAYKNLSAFKIYLNDVGLLRKMSDLPSSVFVSDNPIFKEYKGALSENYVLQSLVAQMDKQPYYWTSNFSAEVDFVLQNELDIIPVEVKSGVSVTGKSLTVYDSKYSPRYKLRYSMLNLSKNGTLINIPLPLADWTFDLVAKSGL